MVVLFLLQSRYQLADHTVMFDEAVKPFRWFLLPSEAADCLTSTFTRDSTQLPFCPPQHRQSVGLPEFIGTSDNGDCDIADFILSTEPDRCSSTNQHSQEDANSAKARKNVSGTVCTEKNPVNRSKYQSKSGGTYSQAHLDTKTVLASENLHRTNQSESKDNSQAKHTQETALCNKSNAINESNAVNESNTINESNAINKSNAINGDTQEVREEKMFVVRDVGVSDSVGYKLGTDSNREDGAEFKMMDSDQDVKTVMEGNDAFSNRIHTDSKSMDGVESNPQTKSVRVGNDSVSDRLGTDSNGEHGTESKIEDKNQTVKTVREDGIMDGDADSAVDKETRKRKKTGEEAQEIAKRSRDKEDDEHEKEEKRKASKWYSPPKTIFAPFLKVSLHYGPRCEKTCLPGFRQSEILTSLLSYRAYLEK